jgi:hypothetical protein
MKKSMVFAGLFQLIVALALAAPAIAQQSTYTIHIPFRFNVSAHELPAGEYRVSIAAPGTVQLRGIDHLTNATFIAPQVGRPAHQPLIGAIVFHRYGRQYFLSQVWFSNADSGYELTVSNTEREYAKQTPGTDTVLRAAK